MSRNLFLRWWKSLTSSKGEAELRPVKKASVLCWDYIVNVVSRMEFSAVVLVKVIDDAEHLRAQEEDRRALGDDDEELQASKKRHRSRSPQHTKRFATWQEACMFLGLVHKNELESIVFFKSRMVPGEPIECVNEDNQYFGSIWQVEIAHSTNTEALLEKVMNNVDELLNSRLELAATAADAAEQAAAAAAADAGAAAAAGWRRMSAAVTATDAAPMRMATAAVTAAAAAEEAAAKSTATAAMASDGRTNSLRKKLARAASSATRMLAKVRGDARARDAVAGGSSSNGDTSAHQRRGAQEDVGTTHVHTRIASSHIKGSVFGINSMMTDREKVEVLKGNNKVKFKRGSQAAGLTGSSSNDLRGSANAIQNDAIFEENFDEFETVVGGSHVSTSLDDRSFAFPTAAAAAAAAAPVAVPVSVPTSEVSVGTATVGEGGGESAIKVASSKSLQSLDTVGSNSAASAVSAASAAEIVGSAVHMSGGEPPRASLIGGSIEIFNVTDL